MIDNTKHVKTCYQISERFTCTNTTPIISTLSNVHNQIQAFEVSQTTRYCFSNYHSRIINRIFDRRFLYHTLSFPISHATTYPSKYILQSKLCYALPLKQGDLFYLGSLFIQGDQLLLIGEFFMASILLIRVIHISCLSHQLYLRSSSPS